MSRKQQIKLDVAWRALLACVESRGRFCTAGEVAKELGMSRNTAFKYLSEMLALETIVTVCQYRGNVPVYRYGIAGYPEDKQS